MHSFKLAMKAVSTRVGEKTRSVKVKDQSGNCYQREWQGKSLGQEPGDGGAGEDRRRRLESCYRENIHKVWWDLDMRRCPVIWPPDRLKAGGGLSLPIWTDGAMDQGRAYKRRSTFGERAFNLWCLVFNACAMSRLQLRFDKSLDTQIES